MSVQKVTLYIEQGTSWSIVFPIVDANGEPITDLSGWHARAQIRRTTSDPVALFEWSTASNSAGRIELENGRCALILRPDQSSAWTWRRAVYDLELIAPNGDVWRPVGGRVWLRPEVTR